MDQRTGGGRIGRWERQGIRDRGREERAMMAEGEREEKKGE
jgi:hypothetical protein